LFARDAAARPVAVDWRRLHHDGAGAVFDSTMLNPDKAPFASYPFGVDVIEQRTFGGIGLPSRLRAGWWWGTDRENDGEFFRATHDIGFASPGGTCHWGWRCSARAVVGGSLMEYADHPVKVLGPSDVLGCRSTLGLTRLARPKKDARFTA